MSLTIRIDDNTFAAACYDQNSITELRDALDNEPDQTDCETWGIDADEWSASIRLALAAKLGDEYGYVQPDDVQPDGGEQVALAQQAYACNYGTDGEVRYRASGVDAEGNDYRVEWITTDAWDAAQAECRAAEREAANEGRNTADYPASISLLEDESNACDWDAPVSVERL